MNSIFKANDVRGIYPSELNEAEVRKIGQALAGYFGKGAKLIIGHDARLSSPSLYRELKGSLKVGSGKLPARLPGQGPGKVIHAGLMTTPMLYFLVADNKADGGIMVTASHNPKEYNGLKVVKKGARPVGGKEIENMVKG